MPQGLAYGIFHLMNHHACRSVARMPGKILEAKQSRAGISSCEKAQTQALQDSLCTMAYVRRPRPALERGESHSPMLVMGIWGIMLIMQSHMALSSGVGA